MVADRAAHRGRAAQPSSSSPAARCSSPTTPRSTSASSRPRRAAHGIDRGRGRAVRRHRPPRPPGADPRRGPQLQAAPPSPGYFRATTTPNHRALADARATVDVLHGLLERVGTEGVHSLEELSTYSSRVVPAQRRKRHLADGLPRAPGVYLFRDAAGERALRRQVARTCAPGSARYFTGGETRSRMAEMVGLAERVHAVPCATALEAEVRELRLIAEHKPRYNRRSRFPERAVWVKLTVEAFPRLSVVREVRDDGAAYLGPFGRPPIGRAGAVAAVHEAFPLRQCTARLSVTTPTSACALAEMGRCGAPCAGPGDRRRRTPSHVDAVRARAGRATPAALIARCRAADRPAVRRRALRGGRRAPRPAGRLRPGRRPRASGSPRWPPAASSSPPDPPATAAGSSRVVRHGRLAGAGSSPARRRPAPTVDALLRHRRGRRAGCRAAAGRNRRGDRARAALARRRPAPAWCTSTAPGAAGPRTAPAAGLDRVALTAACGATSRRASGERDRRRLGSAR